MIVLLLLPVRPGEPASKYTVAWTSLGLFILIPIMLWIICDPSSDELSSPRVRHRSRDERNEIELGSRSSVWLKRWKAELAATFLPPKYKDNTRLLYHLEY